MRLDKPRSKPRIDPFLNSSAISELYSGKRGALSGAQEIHLMETTKELDILYYNLAIKYAGHGHLLEIVLELVEFAKEIIRNAHKFDFNGIPANGYRTLVSKFIQFMQYTLQAPANRIEKLVEIMSQIRSGIPIVRHSLHEPLQDVPRIEIDRMVDFLCQFAKNDRALDIIFEEDIALRFGNSRSANIITSFVFFVIAFVTSDSWVTSLYSLFFSSVRRKVVRDYYSKCSLEKLVKVLSYSHSFWHYNLLPFLAFGFSPSVKEYVNIDRQQIWKVKLGVSSVDLVKNPSAKSSGAVKCCILRQNVARGMVNKFDGIVLVYVHGGGFVSTSVENTTNFLPSFCKKMPGLTVLSLKVSLAPQSRFPTQIQEVLDVYLWLQNGHQSVHKILGFKPKSFIFGCDSSGAHITMSTLVVLNDMNIRNRVTGDPEIRLPLSVVAHVPAFHVAPIIMPSMLIGARDLILFPTVMSQMSFSYMPNIAPPGQLDSTIQINQPSSWFLNSPQRSKQLLWKYEFLFKHPYYSPVLYNRLEDLSSIELHVLACHEDPLLDSSILMLRRWQGRTSLHVSYDLRHAFFYFYSAAIVIFRSIRGLISEAEDILVSKVCESVRNSVPNN